MRKYFLGGVILSGLIVITMILSLSPVCAVAADISHTVIKGDDLHLLAGYYYRDPRRWDEIYRANRKTLRNKNILRPGSVLIIPDDNLSSFPLPYEQWRAKVGK